MNSQVSIADLVSARSRFQSTRSLLLRCGVVAALAPVAGCASETLFQSNFDATPIGQPPAHAQQVGTANPFGPAGSVTVVAPPVQPSGRWLRVARPNGPDLAGMQGEFSKFVGAGKYTFSTFMFMPSKAGLATIQFESLNQPIESITSFLHLDFTQDNMVRLDDNDATKFGAFPRDQLFVVQVNLDTTVSVPTAHIVLTGSGATGTLDYNILPQFRSLAQQFGAVRLWMGFPWTGSFEASSISVTHQTQ